MWDRPLYLGAGQPRNQGSGRPAHDRYPFGQAEPPSPVTCMVYVLVAAFIVGVVVFIALKGAGVI